MGHRFFADENFPQPAIERLRELGHDVLGAESGHSGVAWPDESVLGYAVSEDRAVLTLNRRPILHPPSMVKCLVILRHCRLPLSARFPGSAERIHAVTSGTHSLQGQLVRVSRSSDAELESSPIRGPRNILSYDF